MSESRKPVPGSAAATPASARVASPAALELGRRVRTRRQEMGLSLERLAEGSALHWSYIGQVERGKPNLTLHSLLRLASALGVDPGDLVAGLREPDETS